MTEVHKIKWSESDDVEEEEKKEREGRKLPRSGLKQI